MLALFALAEWPWLIFGFIGLTPWLAAIDRTKTIGGAFLAGLLMSLSYVLTVGYWVPDVIGSFSGASWGSSLLVTILISPLIQPQFIALALARRLAREGSIRFIPAAPLAGAFAYVGVEWAIPKFFSDTLGHMLFGSVLLRQAADVAGILGLTFLLLLVNDCILVIIRNLFFRKGVKTARKVFAPAVCLVLLLLVPLGYGVVRHHQFTTVDTETKPVTAGLVQAGFSHFTYIAADFGEYMTVRTILDTHVALSRGALEDMNLDLLVWPETVYPLPFKTPSCDVSAAFDRRIEELVTRTGVPLVFGAYDIEDGIWFNAAFFLEPLPDGGVSINTYRKTRPFPFIEQAPGILNHEIIRRHLPWLGTFKPGPGPRAYTLTLADGRSLCLAPMICYDALASAHAIAAVRKGGEVLLTLSNDSWFEYGNTPRHILTLSAFRSIETRRPQLRATVTGISAVITPTGEIIDSMGLQENGVLVGSVIPGSSATLMLLLGDWFGPTALAAAFLLMGMSMAVRHTKRN